MASVRIPYNRIASFTLTFFLMFALWIIFSGIFEPLFIWMGIISSIIVATMCHELLFPHSRPIYFRFVFTFIAYLPWLLWQILKANLHLMKIVFHPRMMDMIDPHIITFRTPLKSPLSITAMANSITLTPGTITVSADREGLFRVHAIDKTSAEGLPGTMGKKIERVFEDKSQ